MEEALLCFFIALATSFVGSIQFGPVNLKVIYAAYNYSFRSALLVASGGILAEIIYSAIAIWFSWLLLSNPLFIEVLQLIAIPFFLVSGILMIMKKKSVEVLRPSYSHTFFISGFLAGALNPLLFTFWFMVINFLVTGNIIALNGWTARIVFVIGAAVGAFLLLLLFAWITHRNKLFLERILAGKLDKWVGAIFIILAIVQFLQWLR